MPERNADGTYMRGVSRNAGEENPAYKHGRYADGGVSKRNLKAFALPLLCEACLEREAQLWHHVDEDRQNNARENLRAVCRPCHARIHGLGGAQPAQGRDPQTGRFI